MIQASSRLRSVDGSEMIALDSGFAELVFLDLAARGHRVLLDEVYVLGNLIGGDVLAAVFYDVFRGKRCVPLWYYGGGYLLAVLLVGNAVDLHIGDVRMSVEELL